MKESKGLDPSVYGGGGSPSSALLPEASPFVSGGSAALVSASAVLGTTNWVSLEGSNGGAGAKAVSVAESVAVIEGLKWWTVSGREKYKDENGGGRGDGGVEEDDAGAKRTGECGEGSV